MKLKKLFFLFSFYCLISSAVYADNENGQAVETSKKDEKTQELTLENISNLVVEKLEKIEKRFGDIIKPKNDHTLLEKSFEKVNQGVDLVWRCVTKEGLSKEEELMFNDYRKKGLIAVGTLLGAVSMKPFGVRVFFQAGGKLVAGAITGAMTVKALDEYEKGNIQTPDFIKKHYKKISSNDSTDDKN